MNVKFIRPSHEIEMVGDPSPQDILGHIERCGRTCYKSESKITENSSEEFVKKIIKLGHESVLEHFSFSVRFLCDRGVTHELVRHRLASFSQESTRYVGYRDAVEFIVPNWLPMCEMELNNVDSPEFNFAEATRNYSMTYNNSMWVESMIEAACTYGEMIENKWKPQEARSVLPNSLKTEIVTTANLREWRHILKLRTGAPAHPQIREIMNPLLTELRLKIPIVFDDIEGVV